MNCPHCGSETHVETTNIPPPHHGKRICKQGHFVAWISAPITFERADAFVMPFGMHQGLKFSQIKRSYVEWLATDCKNEKIKHLARIWLEATP